MSLFPPLADSQMSETPLVSGLTLRERNSIKSIHPNTFPWTTSVYILASAASVFTSAPQVTATSLVPSKQIPIKSNSTIKDSATSVWSTGSISLPGYTHTQEMPNFSLRLADLKEQTGLTWDQIARLFGVSRRAVHHWAVGGKMNSFNIETLAYLESHLNNFQETDNPEARKQQIFSATENGKSKFEIALTRVTTPGFAISGSALSASEQIASLPE